MYSEFILLSKYKRAYITTLTLLRYRASRRHSPTRGQRSTLRHGNCFPGPSLAVAGLSEFGDEYSAPGMMTSSTSSTPSSSPSVNCVLRSTPEECFLSHDLKGYIRVK